LLTLMDVDALVTAFNMSSLSFTTFVV